MKRIISVSISAATVGMLLAILSVVPASSQVSRTELHVYETENGLSKFLDLGKTGFSSGDKQLENLPVFDQTTDDKLGRTVTEITFVRGPADNPLIFIDCEVQFDDGSAIVFAGAGRFAEVVEGLTLAVTGGTGTYMDASGTITITAQENGHINFDFDLQL
ncbi:MAG: hypothetical protein M3277_08275 [Actinomycetota bacterium]|nr:hypothetical protein [Actinomycetota bacterium]